jgi:hypothetical protein
MLETLDWLRLESESGLWRLLKRLGITYHRGRSFVRSPDDDFDAKCEYLDDIRNRVLDRPDEALVYMDEMQYFRRPVEERVWEQAGKQATVPRKPSSQYDWSRHVMGAVEAESGELLKRHSDGFDRFDFLDFYERLIDTMGLLPNQIHSWSVPVTKQNSNSVAYVEETWHLPAEASIRANAWGYDSSGRITNWACVGTTNATAQLTVPMQLFVDGREVPADFLAVPYATGCSIGLEKIAPW